MYSKPLRFNKDGSFKIMQIADVQEVFPVSVDTVRLISLAVEKEKPDLVIFTGDQINGFTPCFRTKNAADKVKAIIAQIVAPIEKANIPFAVTFGNHDDQCGISNQKQYEYYAEYPHCICENSFDKSDKGSCMLSVFDADGKQKLSVCLIDTGGQSPNGEYFPVTQQRLDAFKKECEKAYVKNGYYVPTIVFQHIPVPEYYNVLTRAKRFDKGAVEAFRTHKNEFYVLPEDIISAGGFMLESPATPDKNSGEFSVLQEKGNVMAIVVGHDHNNSFVSEYNGIKLIYTQCAGFNVYGPHLKRGVRIIEFSNNDATNFNTHTLTYDELTNQKLSSTIKEFVLTHLPTNLVQVKRVAFLTLAGASLGSAAIIYKVTKKLK